MEQEIRPRRFIRTAYHCGSLYGPDKKKTGTRIARNDKGKTYYVPADMTYEEWYNKYIESTIIPTGNANWKTNEQGYVIVTKQIPKIIKHYRTATHAEPNSVVMHYGKPGPHEQMDYDFYDENGYLAMQIHCGNHLMPKKNINSVSLVNMQHIGNGRKKRGVERAPITKY